MLSVAEAMLNGELEYRKGNHDAAFAYLRSSVELSDSLPYDEPWGWMQPTRHALGALLLEQGREAAALSHLQKSVELDPNSEGARYNLGVALARLGRHAEAVAQLSAAVRLNPAHGFTDVPPDGLPDRGRGFLETTVGESAAARARLRLSLERYQLRKAEAARDQFPPDGK